VTAETGLESSSLRITSEAVLESGELLNPQTYTIPLVTRSFGNHAHLAVRDSNGVYGDPLKPGQNDILTDCWLPGLFIRTGQWTFRVEGLLPDGRFLFCFEISQWIKGRG
jgi:hypothetical protein